jgi:hypothetical protein
MILSWISGVLLPKCDCEFQLSLDATTFFVCMACVVSVIGIILELCFPNSLYYCHIFHGAESRLLYDTVLTRSHLLIEVQD